MPGWRIGLLGIGAIGRDVVQCVTRRRPDAEFIVLRRSSEPLDMAGVRQVDTIEKMIAVAPDVVVEAAGRQAVHAFVPTLLGEGVSVIAASAGPLVEQMQDESLFDALSRMARDGRARLIVPAGAIGGLDYIGAVALLDDLRIVYTSRKPPEAWLDELAKRDIAPASLKRELALFEGSVAEAAALYPRNLNVAATLALACGRPEAVSVRVVVDPAAQGNTHEIACESGAGSARFEFVNAPAPSNPKTSMVTALSLVRCVEDFFAARST